MTVISKTQLDDALKLIVGHARGDTGGSNRCAAFILSLWDGDTYPLSLQGILFVDPTIFSSMIYILNYFYDTNTQLDTFINEKTLETIFVFEDDKWIKR